MRNVFLTLAIVGVMVSPAVAVPTFVAGGSAYEDITTGDPETLATASLNLGSGNYVVVGLTIKVDDDASPTGVGMTYDTNAMTLIGTAMQEEGSWRVHNYIYGYASTSASGIVEASYQTTSTSDFDGVALTAASYSDATGFVTPLTSEGSGQQSGAETITINKTVADSVLIINWGLGGAAVGTPTAPMTIEFDAVGTGMCDSILTRTVTSSTGDIDNELDWDETTNRHMILGGELVPEPATLALLACGGLGLLIKRRRRIA